MRGANVHVLTNLGVAVHMVSVEGTLGMERVSKRHFDPAARLGVVANYEVGRNLDVGITMSADCLLQRQKYDAGTTEVLVVPRLQLTTSLVLAFRIL
ncbi:MAG: hypothetical protein H0T79_07265 [Deltaproteobacteria bacterium]|nr:hypothetical protein [Deltaproteobacteria bacterium]